MDVFYTYFHNNLCILAIQQGKNYKPRKHNSILMMPQKNTQLRIRQNSQLKTRKNFNIQT